MSGFVGSLSASSWASPRASPDDSSNTGKAAIIAAGRQVLLRHECRRCHTIDDLPLPPLAVEQGADAIARDQNSISHPRFMPDLTRIAARIRPDWIAAYLAQPYSVRPLLAERMIRHQLNADEQRAVVRYFSAVAVPGDQFADSYTPPNAKRRTPTQRPTRITPARVVAGGTLFSERGCTLCHTLGNNTPGKGASRLNATDDAGAPIPAAVLAPDLRFVKLRMRPDVLVEWLLEPRTFSPTTLMPGMGLHRQQAELLRDFLFSADPQPLSRPTLLLP